MVGDGSWGAHELVALSSQITFMTPQEAIKNLKKVRDEVLDTIDAAISALESQAEKQDEWPKKGERFYYVDVCGEVDSHEYDGLCSACTGWKPKYRTREEAQHEALRRESMSKRWRPNDDETYHYFSLVGGGVYSEIYNSDSSFDHSLFFIGNCHPDEKSAREWFERYGESWKVLLK